MKTCKHIYYSGNVQGVGFRFSTMRVAGGYQVTGFVRNMMDGRVEVLAEGDADEVDRFIEGIADAMSGYIRDTRIIDEPYTGRFSRFDIRH